MQTLKSKRLTSASCALGLLLALGFASPVGATEPIPEKGPSAAQYQLWDALDISSEIQEELAQKIDSGQVLDVDDVRQEVAVSETETVAGYIQTTETFEDGSVAFSFVETPEAEPLKASDEVKLTLELADQTNQFGAIQPAAVGTCLGGSSGSGYSTWRDCLVTGTTGALTVHFRATYTFVNGVGDSISSVNSPMAVVSGGTATTPKLKIQRSKETSSAKAQARATTVLDRFLGGTSTHTLALNVGGNTASTSWI